MHACKCSNNTANNTAKMQMQMHSFSTTLTLTLLFLLQTLTQTHSSCQVESDPFFNTTIFTTFINTSSSSNCLHLHTLNAHLSFSYLNTTPNFTLSFLFSALLSGPTGWVAWGLNPNSRPSMVGTRALFAILGSSGKCSVASYTLDSDLKDGCYLEDSPVDIRVDNMSCFSGDGRVAIGARLSLPVSVYNASKLRHAWQVGQRVRNGVPQKHELALENFDSVGVFDVNQDKDENEYSKIKMIRIAHGILAGIGWGILLPCGVLIIRYFREYPFKYEDYAKTMHVCCQVGGFVLGGISWALGLALINYHSPLMTFQRHRNIGITIFWVALVQITALWLKPDGSDKYRKYWNIFHHFLGYSLISLTIVNILKGLKILNPPSQFKCTYIGFLIAIACAVFILEIITWIKFLLQIWIERIKHQVDKRPVCKPYEPK